MIGNADGLMVVSPLDAAAVAQATRKKPLIEQAIFQKIGQGTLDRAWVGTTLAERCCEIIDAAWHDGK